MFPSSSHTSNRLDHHIMLHHHHHIPIPSLPMPMPPLPSSTRWKPTIEVAPNCPRCASTNTKFCYYNNYSLSQPRYFCKACRRYWTKGGSLRNVPVGGGCRKNRRSKPARHQTEHQQQHRCSTNSDEGEYSSSADGDAGGGADQHSSSSREIDMAVVFANFLNQTPIGGEDHGGSSSSSGETEKNLDETVPVVTESQEHDDLGALCADVEPSSFEQELSLMSGIELDAFDDVVHHVWSHHHHDHDHDHHDGVATWQPPSLPLPLPPPPTTSSMMHQMQMDELEFDDELLMMPSSMNLMSDSSWNTNNWSSFDLSTIEGLNQ
ncbi:hypothetical protein PIB30_048440 [Stylosanthes scabra]|uniref:Dof zinc finger protein n=1 Tax=Stylosanthes scabra TaxID=79078 RepID=A0ABU6VIM1_9FABA|nr:hypothetical protein [Stylosanthes scabra]